MASWGGAAKAGDPARVAKAAASNRGKRRGPEAAEALRRARLGVRHTQEARARMSGSHTARGARPATFGVPWAAQEDALALSALPAAEVAAEVAGRTGRSLWTVYCRRHHLRGQARQTPAGP